MLVVTTVGPLWNGSGCPYYVILAPPTGKYPTHGQVPQTPTHRASGVHPFILAEAGTSEVVIATTWPSPSMSTRRRH